MEKIMLVPIWQWQVRADWPTLLRNWTDFSAPFFHFWNYQLSGRLFLRACLVGHMAVNNVHFDRGPNPCMSGWMSFPLGAFTESLLFDLTLTLHMVFFSDKTWKGSGMKYIFSGLCPDFQKCLCRDQSCLTLQYLSKTPENSGLEGGALGLVRRVVWCVFMVEVYSLEEVEESCSETALNYKRKRLVPLMYEIFFAT